MDYKVINNFLPKEEFENLKNLIVYGSNFPLYISDKVTFAEESEYDWRWYANHMIYTNNVPYSDHFKSIYDIFIPKFSQIVGVKSLLRIKVNLYPHTNIVRENEKHADYEFPHHAALFSLNTCDGFTRMNDGTKIDSIENRIVFFDGSLLHNSTTTTNKARYNINFNWL
jgi:hypothetical protein